MDKGGDHLNGRLGLCAAASQHRSKSVTTGFLCCRMRAQSMTKVLLKVVCIRKCSATQVNLTFICLLQLSAS